MNKPNPIDRRDSLRKPPQENKPGPKLREKRDAGGDYNSVNPSNDDSHVEFFSPEMRSELENRDETIRKQTGSKGAAPGGDSWVWLTSYSRIPVSGLLVVGKVWMEDSVNFN